jgi:SpoVK/Ycf46/Vps4 family AAA+-type ATPase
LLRDQQHSLSDADLDRITQLSEGYSGADIKVLCSEASMGPIRDLVDILNASKSQVRSINMSDFERALRSVRASVAPSEITAYLEWNNTFGTVKGN